MSTGHSWKWLAPRLSAEQVRTSARAAASADDRPCLPKIEALGDRILFSSTTTDALTGDGSVAPDPGSPEGILIGLIKGELDGENALIKGELNFLKLGGEFLQKKHIAGIKWSEFHKMASDVGLVNQVISKYVEDVLSGQLPAVQKVQVDLDAAIKKLADDANALDGGEQTELDRFAPSLSLAASDLLKKLNLSQRIVKVTFDYKQYSKIAAAVGDLTTGLVKFAEDVIAHKSTNADTEYLKIKLSDILISGLKLTDSPVNDFIKGELSTLEGVVGKLEDGVASSGGGIKTDAGVTLTSTGDILK